MTSIVLQLGHSDLESPFDGLLPYEDWPLMCWTYGHQLSPEICEYHVLVVHTRESVTVAVFHLHVSSLYQPPGVCILILPMYILPSSIHSRKHTNVAHFAMFQGHSMWCTYLSISVEFSDTW